MSRKITNLPVIYSKEGLSEPGFNLQIYNFLKQLTRFCLYQPSGIPGDKYKQKRGSFLLSVFYFKRRPVASTGRPNNISAKYYFFDLRRAVKPAAVINLLNC